jgi:anti-sigma-K factor RskA
MSDPHLPYRENLAAYAVQALEADEDAALKAHLQTCESCGAQLTDYQRLSAGLLSALPPQAPRPALRRILQRRLSSPMRSVRPQFKLSWGQVGIASVSVLLIAFNLISISQIYSLKEQQAELSRQFYSEQTAIAMLSYPGTQSIAFNQEGIVGSLLVDKNRNLLAVFAWHLPPTPQGKTYQMWLIDPQGDRTSGGFLTPEADQPFAMAVIASPQPLAGFAGFGITLEPSGGSPQPTGPKILRVNF